jgi:hypothetical protein
VKNGCTEKKKLDKDFKKYINAVEWLDLRKTMVFSIEIHKEMY